MHNHYQDLLVLGEPRWWDENVVPRYCEPHPENSANIYADEFMLETIECQNCGRRFLVASSESKSQRFVRLNGECDFDAPIFDPSDGAYCGDPPNIDCCASGPTMTSNQVCVESIWRKNKDYEWELVYPRVQEPTP